MDNGILIFGVTFVLSHVKNISLSYKILFAILVIFFPIVMTVFAGYVSNRKHMETLISNDFRIIAEGYEKLLSRFLEMNERRVRDFSTDGFISEALEKIIGGDHRAVNALNNYLIRNKLPLEETLHSIHIISTEGVVIASTHPSLIGKEVTGEQFFIDFKKGKRVAENMAGFESIPTISVTSPIKDQNGGAILGLLSGFISLSELGRVMSGEIFTEMGAITMTKGPFQTMEVYVVDGNGFMLTKSRFIKDAVLRQRVDTPPVRACIESNREMTGFYGDYRGVDIIGSSMCIPSLKWTLLVEVDRGEIQAPLLRIKRGFIATIAVISLFIGMLFLFIREAAIIPLNSMSEASKEIAHGNFKVTIPVRSGDEIGALAKSFNDMARQLDADTEKLRKSEASLNEAQRIAQVGSWERDLKNNILLWSDEIYHIFEIDGDRFSASFEIFLKVIHPEDRAMVDEVYKESLKSGGPYSIDYRLLFPDGRIKYVHEQCETSYDKEGKPFRSTGTVQDVTARKIAEQEIIKLNEELEQRVMERTSELAAANRELEAFTYSVSHDLRAPLRHIMGFVELLQKQASSILDETSDRYMKTIVESAKKMGILIDDLLAFSRAGRLEMQKKRVSFNQLVDEVLSELKKGTEKRHIEWKIDDLPDVYGDPTMLKLVFLNLISNALKFTSKKKKVKIEVGWERSEGDDILIFVRDNGAGFDMKYQDKLFGVFQRLHKQTEFEGTGIGLANVRRIIDRHGGRIWGTGAVNEGATFYFTLPISRKA